MSDSKKINRRTMILAGAGMAASAVATRVVANPSGPTPANPEGPFYPKHKQLDKDTDLTRIEGHTERALGQVIRVEGQVIDEGGEPVAGALVDIWQANAAGRYDHEDDPALAPLDPNFQGWGMVKTDDQGRYSFTTIKPGAYSVDAEWSRPPHIHFKVSRRGYHELTTQMYFAGESLNATDRFLQDVPEDKRSLLVVDFEELDGAGIGTFPITLAKVT